MLAFLGKSDWGRWLVRKQNSLMRGLTDEDWRMFRFAANAHTAVRAESRYIALVVERRQARNAASRSGAAGSRTPDTRARARAPERPPG